MGGDLDLTGVAGGAMFEVSTREHRIAGSDTSGSAIGLAAAESMADELLIG